VTILAALTHHEWIDRGGVIAKARRVVTVVLALSVHPGLVTPVSGASTGVLSAPTAPGNRFAIIDKVLRAIPSEADDMLRWGAVVDLALRPGGGLLAVRLLDGEVARCDSPVVVALAKIAVVNGTEVTDRELRITDIRDTHEVSAHWRTRVCSGLVRVNAGDWREAILDVRLQGQATLITFTVNE